MIYNLDMNMAISLEKLLQLGLLDRRVLIFSENYDNSGVFIHTLDAKYHFFKFLFNFNQGNYLVICKLLENFTFEEMSLHSLIELILYILTKLISEDNLKYNQIEEVPDKFILTISEVTYVK